MFSGRDTAQSLRGTASYEPGPLSPAPTFCIILLVFNDLPHCIAAIESVLAQTDEDFELMIVDNGSTDRTIREVERFSAFSRVRVIRLSVNERSNAVQSAIECTTASYLSFLFADDTYHPERLRRARELLVKNPHSKYIFFNNKLCDEYGVTLATDGPSRHALFAGDISVYDRFAHLRYAMDVGNTLHPCGMVVDRSVYLELGGFPGTMHRIGDLAFFTRLLSRYEGLFAPEKMQTITVWRNGRNQSARNLSHDNEMALERALVLERWLEPGIIDNLERIFCHRQSIRMTLRSRADRLWFLAHQVLKCPYTEHQLFGLRLLYEAAAQGDPDFQQDVIRMTGYTASQYIQHRVQSSGMRALNPESLLQRYLRRSWLVRLAPTPLVKELGKLLSTLGYRHCGSILWNISVARAEAQSRKGVVMPAAATAGSAVHREAGAGEVPSRLVGIACVDPDIGSCRGSTPVSASEGCGSAKDARLGMQWYLRD